MNLVKLQDTKLKNRNLSHFYTLAKKDQNNKSTEKIPFAFTSQRIKYQETNLPKEIKDLYFEKYETDERYGR